MPSKIKFEDNNDKFEKYNNFNIPKVSNNKPKSHSENQNTTV